MATLEKFAKCMRANGVPDFPDPSSGGAFSIGNSSSDLKPTSPTFQHASKLCDTQTGMHLPGKNQPGSIVPTTASAGVNG